MALTCWMCRQQCQTPTRLSQLEEDTQVAVLGAAHHGAWDEWYTDGQASWCGAWKDVMKAGVPPSLEPWTWIENSFLSFLETQTKLTEMATLF